MFTRKHWKTDLGHLMLGLWVALMFVTGEPGYAWVVFAGYLVYQSVEVVRRVLVPLMSGTLTMDEAKALVKFGDTPAKDVMVAMIPLCAILFLDWVLNLWFNALTLFS